MGDTENTTRTKNLVPSAVICPMLNSSNYTVWSMRIKVLLRVHKVWETIDASSTDDEKNNMAIALLFQSIPETLILQVGELDTAKKVWEAIKTRHVGAERVKEARLQTLMSEFDRLKMKDSEKIDDFAGKLSEILSKSAALGVNIEESKLVKKFLKSLPRKKYIHIVASFEQVLDLNTTSFEDIIGRLIAYEERISEEEEETQEDQSKLIGRGRGQFYGIRDTSRVTFYRCDKICHFASNCPDRLLKLQETQETENNDTQDADELMMHEVVYLNEKNCIPNKYETNTGEENIWYLDNGASNHMIGDRRYF
ncbi:Retrovirus-related Pol polyprotein from transposon TNT 1-94 [Cardamine amara subsp. amara]|uniref:Retrovirus-related Pol polyprotein from transposon TNT 1-94 n=1 Tax=Cardamine amara subsp. amara TaxID=228776 RepID=A0ABD1B8L2_CARAN